MKRPPVAFYSVYRSSRGGLEIEMFSSHDWPFYHARRQLSDWSEVKPTFDQFVESVKAHMKEAAT